MHATTDRNTTEFVLEQRAITGAFQTEASLGEAPDNIHDTPDEVLRDTALATSEKRAILSSWASDANAVEHQPWLRRLPSSGRTVPLAAILAALRRLDDDDPPPKGGAAIRLSDFARDADDTSFDPVQPLRVTSWGGGIMVWRNVQSMFDPARCPVCGATMQLARVEPRPVGRSVEFERHTYRCDDCENTSRFVIDRHAVDRMPA